MKNKNFDDRWWMQPDGETIQVAAAEWFARLSHPDANPELTDAWKKWMKEDPRHAQAFARVEDAGSVLQRLSLRKRAFAWTRSILRKAFQR